MILIDKLTSVIPLPYRIAIGVTLLALIFGAVYYAGGVRVQKKWDLENIKTALVIAELKTKSAEKTVEVVTRYVDRVKTVVERGDVTIKYVDKYITAEDNEKCVIPESFVQLHDASSQNIVPDPNTIITGVASDVTLSDVSKTVFSNYKTHHKCVEQVLGLQDWIKTQQKLNP